MSIIKQILLPVCVTFLCFQSTATANEYSNQSEVKKIEAVIEAFRMSLINMPMQITQE